MGTKRQTMVPKYKTKDWAALTLFEKRGHLRCSGRLNSSCSTRGTRQVSIVYLIVFYLWFLKSLRQKITKTEFNFSHTIGCTSCEARLCYSKQD